MEGAQGKNYLVFRALSMPCRVWLDASRVLTPSDTRSVYTLVKPESNSSVWYVDR